jgi:hypothetical protein
MVKDPSRFAERMDLLCEFTDLVLQHDPRIGDFKDAQQTAGRVRVLTQEV